MALNPFLAGRNPGMQAVLRSLNPAPTTQAPAPTPAVVPQPTGGGTPAPTGGGTPIQGVRGDQDLFNRLFGKPQDGGGYAADQVIANTMQNRNILPAPVNYTQTGLSPNIQRRMDLMTASNPVDALRNPPAGPAMARDNGQAIARNAPFTGSATWGEIRRGEKARPNSPNRPANLQGRVSELLGNQPQGLLTPWTGPGLNPMHTGKMPNAQGEIQPRGKMPQGGA